MSWRNNNNNNNNNNFTTDNNYYNNNNNNNNNSNRHNNLNNNSNHPNNSNKWNDSDASNAILSNGHRRPWSNQPQSPQPYKQVTDSRTNTFQLCFFFHNNGFCTKCPKMCTKKHVEETSISWTKHGTTVPKNQQFDDEPCQVFRDNQHCPSGHQCKYLHILNCDRVPTVDPANGKGKAISSPAGEGSTTFKAPMKHAPLPPTDETSVVDDVFTALRLSKQQKPSSNSVIVSNSPPPPAPSVAPPTVLSVPTKTKETKPYLDVVLVMDCTDGMEKWLVAARDNIGNIIEDIKRQRDIDMNEYHIRLGVVVYRDYDINPPESRIRSMDFTTEIAHIQKTIEQESAFGKGDVPDDVVGGLQAALDMSWQAVYRMIVLVADSPCHGKKYHNIRWDERPDPRATGEPTIEDQMREMAQRKIAFVMLEVTPSATQKMVSIMRTTFEQANKHLLFYTKPFKADLSLHTTKAISQATQVLQETMLNAVTLLVTCKEEDNSETVLHPWMNELSKKKFEWNELLKVDVEYAVRYSYSINLANVDKIKLKKDTSIPHSLIKETIEKTHIRIMSNSKFDDGNRRTAHGFQDETQTGIHRVAMVFTHLKCHNLEAYQMDAKARLEAKVIDYLQRSGSNGNSIISVSLYELTDRPNIDYFKYVAVELQESFSLRYLYSNKSGQIPIN